MGMKLITAPEQVNVDVAKSVFLGGGITNCPDWQKEIINLFKDTDYYLLNPRRENFDISDQNASVIQIEWEYKYLNSCDVVLFWFPEEALCPITLFELGKYSSIKRQVFVGCHPNYERKFDVVKQLSLSRSDIKVVFDIQSLANQVKNYFHEEYTPWI
jgi:Nucleoside 2-deoxyribosyltransferase like